jgi:SPP1 gp7 family putative phage head morphogenesis protein
MGGMNRASVVASEQKFVKGCIEPRLKLWEDVINSQLMPLFQNSDDLEFKHESALPKDDEWSLTETQGYLSMGMTTINAERKKKGLKPYDSPLMDVPWMNGEPVRGCKDEADKMWKEKTQDMMGGGMPQPGMAPPGMPQPGMDPAMGGMPPAGGGMPMSSAPAAQGAMGSLGGRPEGQALTTLLTAAARRTNTSMATLLNAARGRRGGLSALLGSHPEFEQLSNILDKNRQDQALTRLIQTNLKGYIENQLEGVDKMMFQPVEKMYSELDSIEDEFQRDLQAFYVRKGNQFSSIVEKMVSGFMEKGSGEGIDLESWRKEYESFVGPIIERGVVAGMRGGLEIIRKSGKEPDEFNPETLAASVAGQLLERSADLRENSVRKAITSVLQEGIAAGSATDDIAFAIRDAVGGDMNEHRAMRIARTELASAMNTGLDASYQEMNKGGLVVKDAVVYTALDERVCEECMALHGEIAKSYVKDVVYHELPVHPNCRCVLRPTVE